MERTRLVAGHIALSHQDTQRRYKATLIEAGLNLNDWVMPVEVLGAALHQFEHAVCLIDHASFLSFPSLRNFAGMYETATLTDDAITATLCLNDSESGQLLGNIFDAWLNDKDAGSVAPIGLSADLSVRWQPRDNDDEPPVAAEILKVWSVDAVLHPAAGGQVERVVNSIGGLPPQSHNGGTTMDTNTTPAGGQSLDNTAPNPMPLNEALASIARVAERIDKLSTQIEALNVQPTEDEPTAPDPISVRLDALTDALDHLTQTAADTEADNAVEGMGETELSQGRNSLDRVKLAFEAMIQGTAPPQGIQPLTGIRELYHLLSGDYQMTGLFQRDNIYLANVNSSTMAGMVANALNKSVINLFQEYPRWWETFVSPEDFATLQQVKWITLGGIGELPTVAEGAAYTELTWDDQTETADFVKKGGYLGITLEAIDKDDTGKLRAAPRALAQAAWLTLSKSISAIFTTAAGLGPDMSDAVALFNASHSNLGSTALSHAAYVATRTAMRKQTELSSSERLGALTAPHFLLVPSDLEITALQVLATEQVPGSSDNNENPFASGNAHEARMRAAQKRVVVVDLWTDTNNWAAVANPNLYPSIGLGFRYGRTPEIFSVASPTAGLMFTNDTMPVKVRFFFATGPTDYRGLYKHNVT
jgi:hypothetical protein